MRSERAVKIDKPCRSKTLSCFWLDLESERVRAKLRSLSVLAETEITHLIMRGGKPKGELKSDSVGKAAIGR